MFISLIVSILSVYVGISIFDRITREMEEWKELKKGNIAVSIVLVSILLSLALILEPQVESSFSTVQNGLSKIQIVAVIMAVLVNLILTLLIATLSVYIAIRIIDRLTDNIDEFAELRKGNVAVGLFVAAVVLVVALLSRAAINNIVSSADLINIFRSMVS